MALMTEGGWAIALITAGSTAAGVIGKAVYDLLQGRHKALQEKRKDALEEWQEITNRQQRQIDANIAEMRQQASEILRIHEEHARCQAELARLEGIQTLQQQTIQRLQGLTGDVPPPVLASLTVVSDENGIILTAGPEVGPLFHWSEEDLIGKSVEVLIPERYLEKHKAGMEALRAAGSRPWSDKPIMGYGKRKNGEEVPVTVTLSAWQDRGDWRVCAVVRWREPSLNERRMTLSSQGPGSVRRPTR